jgi:ABC-type nickel/cobalt efflux system permease component RcnA
VNRWAARGLATLVGAGALLLAAPGAASAHPLGNFTVNRYSGVVVASDSVTVDHVLDLAEIPTAQRTPAIDTSGDGRTSRPELGAWSRSTCSDAAADLRLTVGGQPAQLSVTSAAARSLPGQAGLPVLRVECALSAPVTELTGATAVRLVDGAAGREVGWQEMTARGDGTTLTRSDVPEESTSARLTTYPQDLLTSPLTVGSARLEARPGGTRLQPATDSTVPAGALGRGADRLTVAFEGLLQRYDGGPLAGLVALVAALALGAAHAVAPGHGKTVMAFYLSGRREGALRSAATVGATVTATHTAGVLALGLLVSAGTAFVPARVYPWLSVVSGLLVVAVGLTLLRAARRGGSVLGHTHGTGPGQHTHAPSLGDHAEVDASQVPGPRAHGTDHPHQAPSPSGDHAHVVATLTREDHGHAHDHDHHTHEAHAEDEPATQDVPAPSRRGLVAIGLAGGLLPSPSALLVFLGALALGHPWFGVLLVVAFGVGMATTLALVGVFVMRLREKAERRLAQRPSSRFAPVLRYAPLLTAAVVVLLGGSLALRGFAGTGLF